MQAADLAVRIDRAHLWGGGPFAHLLSITSAVYSEMYYFSPLWFVIKDNDRPGPLMISR